MSKSIRLSPRRRAAIRRQIEALSGNRGSRSHGQRRPRIPPPREIRLSDPGGENLLPEVIDPGGENLLPEVIDPGGENLLPEVIDPSDPLGSPRGGLGGAGCDCAGGVTTVVLKDDDEDSQEGHLPEACFSGWIIIRLAPGLDIEGVETLEDLLKNSSLGGLREILEIDLEPIPGARQGQLFLPAQPLIRNICYQPSKEVNVGNGGDDTRALSRRRRGRRNANPPDPDPLKPFSLPPVKVRDKLAEWTRNASSPGLALGLSLLRYWRIDVRQQPERIEELVTQLQALPGIELAYREIQAEDPGEDDGEIFSDDQSYLDDAPVGIGAGWAKALKNQLNPTTRVRCCDIEQRWIIEHDEMQLAALNLGEDHTHPFFGNNRFDKGENGNHGTAVSAQLVGHKRIQGFNQDIVNYLIASHYDDGTPKETKGSQEGTDDAQSSSPSNGHIAEAVVNVLVLWSISGGRSRLRGEVILIEAQRCGLPSEVDHADFAAFSLATALGVTVVEAAGNAGFDLDAYLDEQGRRILRRGGQDFRDSGAVVVGAAWSALPHDRAWFSNFGSRVDCYAWGDNVTSAGYGDYDPGDGQPISWYTNAFSGTSAAAPIITGAAIWLQYLTRAATQHTLDPLTLRSLLAERSTGTPQGPNVRGHIGVMPDLCAILAQASLGIPQPYLRRTVADNGWTCRDVICASPDILAAPRTNLGSSQNTVGQLWGNEPAPGLSPLTDTVHFFCRPRNRGLGTIERMAHFYVSQAATLIRPDMWRQVGKTSNLVDLDQGGNPSNLGPVSWQVAPAGYYAMLAVLGAEDAPDPLADRHFDWTSYWSFIRHPETGCRNTHWIPSALGDPTPFLITGAHDRLRAFDFEILLNLPARVDLELTVPLSLAVKLRQRQPWKIHWDMQAQTSFQLPPAPRLVFPRIRLAAHVNCAASLQLRGALSDIQRGHHVTIRQFYRGDEVGRLSFFFDTPDRSPARNPPPVDP